MIYPDRATDPRFAGGGGMPLARARQWNWLHCLLCCAGFLVFSGCTPLSTDPLDEQKDPHFIEGKRKVNSLDFQGAMQAFEKALETNPRSAAAHFELAVLAEQKAADYAAAIYHYKKHLALRPNSDLREIVQQRITACTLELAKSLTFGVVTREVQRDLERLHNENTFLKEQIESLKMQLAQRPVAPTNSGLMASNTAAYPPLTNVEPPRVTTVLTSSVARATSNPASGAQTQPRAAKTHVIRAGDTLAGIARRYGVRISSLEAANPGLDPRRLQPGKTLKVPQE